MTKGTKVKVTLKNGKHHIGIYLGEDPVFQNVHFVGVLETTVDPTLKPKAGKKFISKFHAKIEQLSVIS